MFYKDRIKNLAAFCPKLTAVWIRTVDDRLPLKRVWLNESALFTQPEADCGVELENQSVETSEDHLAFAA